MNVFKNLIVIGIFVIFVVEGVLPSINGAVEKNYCENNLETRIFDVKSQNKVESTSVLSEVDWWPMFHHDPCHTGYSTSQDAPETDLILWTKDTNHAIYESPVVIGNKLYIGSSDMYLYCLDAVTGMEIWKYYMLNDYSISPSTCAIVDDRVYFIGINSVICLDADNGDTIWEYQYGYLMPPSIQIPTVVDGKVYFGTGRNNFSNYILCLDAEGNGDGTTDLIWSFETEYEVMNSPVVYENRVYAGNTRLYCLNGSTGDLIWNTSQEYFYSSPSCYNGRVYVGSNYGLFCYNAYDGTEEWSILDVGEIWTTPAIAYGYVYAGSFDGDVFCLDADNGDMKWDHSTGGSVYSSPAVADEKVYIGSNDGYLYCIDYLSGSLIWKDYINDEIRSSPTIANGIVYVGSKNGEIYAYRGGEFKIEIIRPIERYFYIGDIQLIELRRVVRSLIIGRISVIVNAIDTKYGIENVTFYFNEFEIYKTSISDDDNNFIWNWLAWRFPFRPFFIVGDIKAKAENGIGQTIVSERVSIIKIGGMGGFS